MNLLKFINNLAKYMPSQIFVYMTKKSAIVADLSSVIGNILNEDGCPTEFYTLFHQHFSVGGFALIYSLLN